MPTFAWLRNSLSAVTVSGRANMKLVSVPTGQTINRSIFGWTASLMAPYWAYELIAGKPVYVGLQTIRSGYGGTIPHPDSSPLAELSPPGERWLWYEAGALAPAGPADWRRYDNQVLFYTLASYTPRQCETQVLNTYAAQTLDVYVSIACPTLASLGLEASCGSYASVLYS